MINYNHIHLIVSREAMALGQAGAAQPRKGAEKLKLNVRLNFLINICARRKKSAIFARRYWVLYTQIGNKKKLLRKKVKKVISKPKNQS